MPDVIMPRLSDTMEEGELSRWVKNVGDQVRKGDVLAEIESDKATMDLESFDDGVLEQQLVPVGTMVPIGQPVAVIGDGSTIGNANTPTPTATSVPAEGAPDPAEAPEPARDARVEDAPEPEGTPQSEPAPSAPQLSSSGHQPAGSTFSQLRASPLARKVARDHNIDLGTLTGTGPQDRITRADVETAIAQASTAPRPQAPASPPAMSAEPEVADTGDEIVQLSKIRRVTARRLAESQAVPHFFLTTVVEVQRLLALRVEVNAALVGIGKKVSINDMLVRACAVALRAHPEVNSSWGDDTIVRHAQVNVGIAVAIADGLIVPVVSDADRKSLGTIASETIELAHRARTGRLTPKEMTGGTFTISNLGMFGIDQFTAVINPPEAAILAVGAATDVPVMRDGQLVTVPQLKITLTADHRVLDGATAAAFLRDLTNLLEEPLRIML